MADEEEGAGPSEELLTEARNLGWVPKEEFTGPEDKWVDAETFVEKGRHIVPILAANNKRLQRELLTRDKKIDTLAASLESSQRAIRALEKVHTEATQRAVDAAIARTRDEIKAARAEGDVDAEFALQDKLDELKKVKNAPAGATPAEDKETPPSKDTPKKLSPEFVSWNEQNPWFGDDSDPDNKLRTEETIAIGNFLRSKGDKTSGAEFLDKCVAEWEKRQAGQSSRASSKVESPAPRSGNTRSSSGKSYSDLPKEAKQACEGFVGQLVGPDKAYKTVEEWRNTYAKNYFEGE